MRTFIVAGLLIGACGNSSSNKQPDAGPCPNAAGSYTVTVSGQGCGDLDAAAPECITQNACTITLTSSSTAGSALDGTTMLAMDGSFTSAAITEGTSARTGCTGTWDTSSSTLTVDCGGTGTSQSCTAQLKRSATSCP